MVIVMIILAAKGMLFQANAPGSLLIFEKIFNKAHIFVFQIIGHCPSQAVRQWFVEYQSAFAVVEIPHFCRT
jgi:hypothetical protein